MTFREVSFLHPDLMKAIRKLRSLLESNSASWWGDFLPGKGNKYFYSYYTLNDSNRKRPCDLLSRPKQANNHLFREQKVKGKQGCETLAWKNRPFIVKESRQRTLRLPTRWEGTRLSDTKSDVLYHMVTIAQSRVKASVSVHGNWIFLTLHGFNA